MRLYGSRALSDYILCSVMERDIIIITSKNELINIVIVCWTMDANGENDKELKSTFLNGMTNMVKISAVFCLIKKAWVTLSYTM